MAVKDVFRPGATNPSDPKAAKEKSESEGPVYWDQKAKEARAKREYEDEQRQARIAREKEGTQVEPPFQVKGSVDLGHIDFQKQQEELRGTIDKIQTDAQTQIQALNQQNADYRESMHKIQLEMVEKSLKAQIESMQKTLQEGLLKPKDNKSITDQISEITQIASVLGYARPDPQSGLPVELQLKMLEMEMNEKASARKFEWDKMMSERTWQLELKKLEAESQGRAAEFQQEREKRSMFATPFESIGVAFAKGLMDSNKGGGGSIGQRETKRKRSTHRLQVGEGESGTTDCPECGEPVAIAPTARSAVCSSCEATFPITRVPIKEG